MKFKINLGIETSSFQGIKQNNVDESLLLIFMAFFGSYLIIMVLMSLYDFITHVSNVGGKNHNDVKYIATDSHQRLIAIKEQSKQNLKMKLGVKPKYID